MKSYFTKDDEIRFLAGDPDMFAKYFRAYRPMLHNRAYRLLKQREDAEDAVQEAFARIYRNLGKFNHTCKLTTWMLHILSNLCIDKLRRRKPVYSMNPQAAPDGRTPPEPVADDGRHPERILLEREERKTVQGWVADLPDPYRDVFLLRFYSECSIAEIADRLSLEVNTVKSKLFRGKKALRRRYGGYAESG